MKRKFMMQGRSDTELFTCRCVTCGEEYLSGHPDGKFCSKTCTPPVDRAKYRKKVVVEGDTITLPSGVEFRNDVMGRELVWGR